MYFKLEIKKKKIGLRVWILREKTLKKNKLKMEVGF